MEHATKYHTCEICGNEYKPARTTPDRNGLIQRTCSRTCGIELRRLLGSYAVAHPSSDLAFASCLTCRAVFSAKHGRKRHCPKILAYVPRSAVCKECGADFTADTTGGRPPSAASEQYDGIAGTENALRLPAAPSRD